MGTGTDKNSSCHKSTTNVSKKLKELKESEMKVFALCKYSQCSSMFLKVL